MSWLCILLAAGGLQASSIEPWLGGTRPYETVPFEEVNAIGTASTGSNAQAGLNLDWGLLDHWSLQTNWSDSSLGSGTEYGLLGTELRLGEEGDYPLDLSIAWNDSDSWGSVSGPLEQQYVFVFAKEIAENSFCGNLLYDSLDGFEGRLAYRSPYLYWTLQAGLELAVSRDSSQECVLPQLLFLLPGDIGLGLGPSLWPKEGTSWVFHLSYEIFPNP